MANIGRPPCDEGIIRAGTAPAPCTAWTGRWVLAATILGSSMAFIDGTVVNVALPVLQRELNASVTELQWVVEAYALFLAALLLPGGSLGDRFGRRRVFAIGVGLFALASAACGLAGSPAQLVAARAVQGVGAALLVPGSLAIISASFSEAQRGPAIGTWSAFTAITAAVGPILGGWTIEHASWRWAFLINLPLAVVVLAILFWGVPESRDERAARSLDGWGVLLAVLGLGGLVFGLIEAQTLGWVHARVVAALAIGGIGVVGFLIREARAEAPILPLDLFRSRTFSGANLLTLLLYAALGGAMFYLPFNLVQVQGYTPTAAGAAMLPFILIMFALSRWSGGLVARYGARLPLVVGPTVAAVGFALFALPGMGGSYWTTFFPATVVLGVGMAVAVAPLTTTVMGAVEQRHAGVASGINNAVSRTAALLAIALLGIVVTSGFNAGLDRRLAAIEVPPAAQRIVDEQRDKLAGASIPAGVADELRTTLERAIDEAFVEGFRRAMVMAAALALASALSAWLLIDGKAAAST
jgi:EmrB/QacA subfamily drug resistance transporter